jgi:hypothetical protein
VAGAATATALPHSFGGGIRIVADAQSGTWTPVPATIDATPHVVPLDRHIAATPKVHLRPLLHHHAHHAASGSLVTLPRHLNVSASSVPRPVLAGYVHATDTADKADPSCHLQWQTLAAIGFIESDHARSGGSDQPHWNGVANPSILGPVLDGHGGVGKVPDTDGGRLDGNAQWDRAVGPMQFIPSTWVRYAADGNHDGVADPQNIDDSTLAAADYLCATGSDLNRRAPRIRAIYSYNHSFTYVRDVLTVAAQYLSIDPAALGIDGLPVDPSPKHSHHPHHRATSPTPTPSPTQTPRKSSSPTPNPTSSTQPRQPTPSPTQSSSSAPTASPIASNVHRPTSRPRR